MSLASSPHTTRERNVSITTDKPSRFSDLSAGFAWEERLLARWGSASSAIRDRSRCEHCLRLFTEAKVLTPLFQDAASTLIWAAGTGRDQVATEGLVTPVQGLRALRVLMSLTGEQGETIRSLLKQASSAGEYAVLLKGLAARTTRTMDPQFVTEMKELAHLIRGRDLSWLIDKTTCYGIDGLRGFRTFFTADCGTTARLLEEAENDPLLALRIKLDPGYGQSLNSLAAKNQRQVLEAAGGVAVPRDIFERFRTGSSFLSGRGSPLSQYINSAGQDSGFRYRCISWQRKSPAERLRMLDIMEHRVTRGHDFPLRIARLPQ